MKTAVQERNKAKSFVVLESSEENDRRLRNKET